MMRCSGTPDWPEDVEDVRAGVRRGIDILASGGDCCLAPSRDRMLDGSPVENVVAMYDEAYRYSP